MFWDSSAIVPLLLDEPRAADLIDAFDADPVPIVWWGTTLECQAAMSRAAREKRATRADTTEAAERLRLVRAQTREVAPLEAVRLRAMRLLSAHPLRTADSLQLAAALIWCEEQPSGEAFVSLDERLREAARREGFELVPAD